VIWFEPLPKRRIDSTGMYFTPAMRHFDRGWHEPDGRRFQNPQYVFGASAAAALYRRQMIEDISVEGDLFDPDFFAYREDADVAWRAQLLGWRCIYTPAATASCPMYRCTAPGNFPSWLRRARHSSARRINSIREYNLRQVSLSGMASAPID